MGWATMRMESALAAVSADRIANRIEALAAIGRDPAGGITRLGLTAEEQAARDLVCSWLAPLGYQCGQDDAGNLHCRAGGGPRVLVGSHLDTVPRGGAYDGALGVIAAAEVAEALHQAGIALPLHVVAWTGEEGVRFGTGLFGSAAACGVLPAGAWERRDVGGTSALQAAAELLGRPVRPEGAALDRDAVRAYLELHIEQASELERRGCPLGVVTAIVGLYHGRVQIVGRADHAGAAAMGSAKTHWPQRPSACWRSRRSPRRPPVGPLPRSVRSRFRRGPERRAGLGDLLAGRAVGVAAAPC
jgi:allantoate deiminase